MLLFHQLLRLLPSVRSVQFPLWHQFHQMALWVQWVLLLQLPQWDRLVPLLLRLLLPQMLPMFPLLRLARKVQSDLLGYWSIEQHYYFHLNKEKRGLQILSPIL